MRFSERSEHVTDDITKHVTYLYLSVRKICPGYTGSGLVPDFSDFRDLRPKDKKKKCLLDSYNFNTPRKNILVRRL